MDLSHGAIPTEELATKITLAAKNTPNAAHDPHKVPRQGLREIFKQLRFIKNKDDPRLADHRILDFSNDRPDASAARVFFHDRAVECFLSQTPVTHPTMQGNPLCPTTYYTVGDVPGVAIFPGLLSPGVQRVLLDRLLHRDLSNPENQTNLHLHYDISYPTKGRSFFTTLPSNVLFTPKNPNVHNQLDMTQVLRKKLRWMTLGGQYDWTNKVYPDAPPPEFPHDIADLIRGLFDGMLDPQAAIVNVYSPGDTLSLHRDVSEEVDMPLVSISLGCDCLFLIAVEDDIEDNGFKHSVIRLRSGDALVMMGDGRFAWHGVPKIIPDTCPSHLENWPEYPGRVGPATLWDGWMKNKRINLNIRQMV